MNLQKCDKENDIVRGFFQQNGACGYVLKPEEVLGKRAFKTPGSKKRVSVSEPRAIQIKIISCQWLPKAPDSNDIPDPFVRVEIFLANGQVFHSMVFKKN